MAAGLGVFAIRLIKPENFSLVHEFQLSPEIIKSSDQNKLVIKTDRTLNKEIQKIDVTVKAVAAGREKLFRKRK